MLIMAEPAMHGLVRRCVSIHTRCERGTSDGGGIRCCIAVLRLLCCGCCSFVVRWSRMAENCKFVVRWSRCTISSLEIQNTTTSSSSIQMQYIQIIFSSFCCTTFFSCCVSSIIYFTILPSLLLLNGVNNFVRFRNAPFTRPKVSHVFAVLLHHGQCVSMCAADVHHVAQPYQAFLRDAAEYFV